MNFKPLDPTIHSGAENLSATTSAALQEAFTLQSTGKTADAIALYERTLTFDSSSFVGWYNLALAYHSQSNWNKTESALREAIRINPRNVEAVTLMGTALDKLGKRDEARAMQERALQL